MVDRRAALYLDLYQHWATQERDNTPFTPAVQVLHATARGAGQSWVKRAWTHHIARYAENCRVLRRGMTALGSKILVPRARAPVHPHDLPAQAGADGTTPARP